MHHLTGAKACQAICRERERRKVRERERKRERDAIIGFRGRGTGLNSSQNYDSKSVVGFPITLHLFI